MTVSPALSREVPGVFVVLCVIVNAAVWRSMPLIAVLCTIRTYWPRNRRRQLHTHPTDLEQSGRWPVCCIHPYSLMLGSTFAGLMHMTRCNPPQREFQAGSAHKR